MCGCTKLSHPCSEQLDQSHLQGVHGWKNLEFFQDLVVWLFTLLDLSLWFRVEAVVSTDLDNPMGFTVRAMQGIALWLTLDHW